MHDQVRKLCCDYLLSEKEYFRPYVAGNYEDYVAHKRQDGVCLQYVMDERQLYLCR